MFLLFAFIAGFFFHSGGWLAFWTFLALLNGNRPGLLLLLPFFLGLNDQTGLACLVLFAFWALRQMTSTEPKPGIPPSLHPNQIEKEM